MALQHFLRQRLLRIAIVTVLILSLLVGYQLFNVAPRGPANVRTLGTLRRVHFMDENLYQSSRPASDRLGNSSYAMIVTKSPTTSMQSRQRKPGPYTGQAEVSNWLVSYMRKNTGGKKTDRELSESEVLEEWREKRLKMEQALHALLLERDGEDEEEEEVEYDQEYQNYTPLEDANVDRPQEQLRSARVVQHNSLEGLLKDRRSEDFVVDQAKWMETHRTREVEPVRNRPSSNVVRQAPPVDSQMNYRPKEGASSRVVQANKRVVGSDVHAYHQRKPRPIGEKQQPGTVHIRRRPNPYEGAHPIEQQPDVVRVHRMKPPVSLHQAQPDGIHVNQRPAWEHRRKPASKEGQASWHEASVVRKKRALSKQKVTLSDGQLRLRGFPLHYPNLTSESSFQFSREWSPSEGLKEKLPSLKAAVNHSFATGNPGTRHMVNQSMNANIIARGLFQQASVSQFCSKRHLSGSLPTKDSDLDCMLQHMLYDDSTKMIFCYVPKNGCSNMKRMMLILNGILPPSSAADKRPPEEVLKRVKSLHSLSAEEALYRLTAYMKVLIVRNPLERLLSAYKNKLEPPYDDNKRHFFPDNLKWYIVQRSRKEHLSEDLRNGNLSHTLHPSFLEFAHFMSIFDLSTYNEHFKPVLDLCFPCAIQYDFYANFKSLDYDLFALMDYLGIPSSYYPMAISHKSTPTEDYMKTYYSRLDQEAKWRLFDSFASELDFYYSLHPEEESMHKHL